MDLKGLAEERLRNRDPIYGAEWAILGVSALGLGAVWLLIWLA